ncbi:MAG: discoidin domain-containing protein [Caldilineaceae bacterium]|nr:discoidin domain-containing protein [Caldilineaceae bacterium]
MKGKAKRMISLSLVAIAAAAVALLAACEPRRDGSAEVDVTGLGQVSVSAGNWSKLYAVDGDPNTWWSADDFAPQWLALSFTEFHLVNRIEFSVSQIGEGPTEHEIWLKNGPEEFTLYAELVNSSTSDQDVLAGVVFPPKSATGVRITTRQAQGWVALREVRVFSLKFSFNAEQMGISQSW